MIGRRVAFVAELDESDKWNETKVKKITGGDDLPIRRLFKNKESCKNYCKLFIITNNVPEIRRELAMSRRFIILELDKIYRKELRPEDASNPNIVKGDDNIRSKLPMNELIAWVIDCMKYYMKLYKENNENSCITAPPGSLDAYHPDDPNIDIFTFIKRESNGRMRVDIFFMEYKGRSPTRNDYKILDKDIEERFGIKRTRLNNGYCYKGIMFDINGWQEYRAKMSDK